MLVLILSIFILLLCAGCALMECRIMDRLCDQLFDMVRGGQEYENERL